MTDPVQRLLDLLPGWTGGPKQYRAADGWTISDPPGLLPLYRGDTLPGDGPIIVCEGEKCCDVVASIGLYATTSAHGADSASKTDWSPLAGRDVVILPDHDKAGEGYAADVAGILSRLKPPAKVRIVRLPGLPEHGDIADWRDAHDA